MTRKKMGKGQRGVRSGSVFSARAAYTYVVRSRLRRLASLLCGAVVILTAVFWIQTLWTSYVVGYTTHVDGAARKTFAIEAGLQRFNLSVVSGECGWHKGWVVYRKVTTDEASSEFMNAQSRWQFAGFRGYTTTAP